MFFKKKNNHTDFASMSISQQTWIRFKNDRLAMFGLALIVLAATISVLGYLITPDSTPFANDQKPELHIKSPGFEAHLVLLKKNEPAHSRNIFNKMVFGEVSDFASIPYHIAWINGFNLMVEEYTGEEPNNGDIKKFNLADVVYDVNTKHPVINNKETQSITFTKLSTGVKMTVPVAELRQQISNKHFITKHFLLGTDLAGRDLLSRLMIGTRISLTVGCISVIISIVIGMLLGAIAGYYRGWLDDAIMWLINVVWSIPTLLLVIAITLVLGKGIMQVFIAVGLTMWVDVARLIRGQILSIREKEFVEAGRALGYKNGRILMRHVIPNVMGPVIVIAASNFAAAILTEAGLSFLGIGAQPPTPSWGEMINAHRGYVLVDAAYLAFVPGVAIVVLVLAFMLVGNGLRDAIETKSNLPKSIHQKFALVQALTELFKRTKKVKV